ncbi:MAG: adenine phosphoribosyltransferase [Bacteroidales bacterium]|nr:adenine phosphoribosyltransferase [Bacteroidales bacterium]
MKTVVNKDILKKAIRNIPDFPRKGIQFKDITTLLKDPALYHYVIEQFTNYYRNRGITRVVAIESRGFILGGILAHQLGAGFVPVRKPGKLPAGVYRRSYQLEYGEDALEIHRDALAKEDIVLCHDDLLATGGTTLAALDLIREFSVSRVYLAYLVELDALEGRKRITGDYDIFTLIHF